MKRLYRYLKIKLEGKRVKVLIGTHGDFDKVALSVCKKLKCEGYDICISLVFTSQKMLIKEMEEDKNFKYYNGVETMMYDIDGVHFKRQIIATNQKMVDNSDEVIVYNGYNRTYSGTRRIVEYAYNNNKCVNNLFEESDVKFE